MNATIKLDEFTQGYLECAFWADGGELGDATISDLWGGSLARMVIDCEEFQEANSELLARYYEHRPPSHAGHDLWLTRNGHGAGIGPGASKGGRPGKND